MSLETRKLKQALANELANARPPYKGTIGEVYLERAWRRGAEYMALRCVEMIEKHKKTADYL